MRGRSSSKQGKISRVGVSMENHKVDKVKEEPHLSGAYIRSLVKHLTSIKTKDSFNGEGCGLPESVNSNGESFSDHNNMHQESPPPPPQPPPPPPPAAAKKQVRRRQHTSKPYQERLLNMAEARREIVTALKFHRASMKQQKAANNNNNNNHDLQLEPSPPPQEVKSKSRRNPRAYPSSATTTTTTDATTSSGLSNNCIEHYSGLSCPPSVPCYWPISTMTPPPLPPLYHDNLNFTLPNQTLGLNLNFQDFKNLDANLYSSSSSSSSSQSTSSSAATAATEEVAAGMPEEVVANSTTTSSSGVIQNDLHHAMDDEEIEEIRSLGEQLQMEWNDTMNLMMSARWFKFLKTMVFESEDGNIDDEGFHPFDQVMEFPPCMDSGEIEGMDGEWLD